jgi:hypothetical protein
VCAGWRSGGRLKEHPPIWLTTDGSYGEESQSRWSRDLSPRTEVFHGTLMMEEMVEAGVVTTSEVPGPNLVRKRFFVTILAQRIRGN